MENETGDVAVSFHAGEMERRRSVLFVFHVQGNGAATEKEFGDGDVSVLAGVVERRPVEIVEIVQLARPVIEKKFGDGDVAGEMKRRSSAGVLCSRTSTAFQKKRDDSLVSFLGGEME